MDDDWFHNDFFVQLREEHQAWLNNFTEQYRRNWDKLFNKDREAALLEASVRRLLQTNRVTVEPNEDLNGTTQRPDFRCSNNGIGFYVEATCITIEKMAEETGLPHYPDGRPKPFSLPIKSFWGACKKKAQQCSNLDLPTLVAIGTFHCSASVLCIRKPRLVGLLAGEISHSWPVDLDTGTPGDSFISSELKSAAFLRPQNRIEVVFARQSISGLLLCGFGVSPPRVLGALHPDAARPFSANTLPDIEFGSVCYDPSTSQLLVQW